ncbi:hypothetical protein [Nannocystis pusilla]|uniref:hypothetical protein n=1 Tax=Nannocystis pusilla TaxID=889268 RepID=UPI003B7EBB63
MNAAQPAGSTYPSARPRHGPSRQPTSANDSRPAIRSANDTDSGTHINPITMTPGTARIPPARRITTS